MSFKPILIVPGEKKSIFFEIFFKSIKSKSITSPLILICDKKYRCCTNMCKDLSIFIFPRKNSAKFMARFWKKSKISATIKH